MRDKLLHAIIGNDTPPWVVAATRGLLGALIAGATGFLAVWSQTDEVKVLIIAGLSPFLAVLSTRFLGEGSLDTWKNGRGGTR